MSCSAYRHSHKHKCCSEWEQKVMVSLRSEAKYKCRLAGWAVFSCQTHWSEVQSSDKLTFSPLQNTCRNLWCSTVFSLRPTQMVIGYQLINERSHFHGDALVTNTGQKSEKQLRARWTILTSVVDNDELIGHELMTAIGNVFLFKIQQFFKLVMSNELEAHSKDVWSKGKVWSISYLWTKTSSKGFRSSLEKKWFLILEQFWCWRKQGKQDRVTSISFGEPVNTRAIFITFQLKEDTLKARINISVSHPVIYYLPSFIDYVLICSKAVADLCSVHKACCPQRIKKGTDTKKELSRPRRLHSSGKMSKTPLFFSSPSTPLYIKGNIFVVFFSEVGLLSAVEGRLSMSLGYSCACAIGYPH